MAHEYLTGKVEAETAVLQATRLHATGKDGTFATSRVSQLVGAAAAGALLLCITGGTVPPTNGGEPAIQVLALVHAFLSKLAYEAGAAGPGPAHQAYYSSSRYSCQLSRWACGYEYTSRPIDKPG